MNLNGRWKGTKRLYFKPDEAPEESKSIVECISIAKEAFLQLTYSWSYKGREHEGVMLLCTKGVNGIATAAWGDSFHQSGSLMHLEGKVEEDGSINLLGSYSAPPGPDWGWRIVLSLDEGDRCVITMYNIWPEGKEDLAVRISSL